MDESKLRLTVTEIGRGPQPNAAGRVFQPALMTKADRARMGLAISRMILKAPGGGSEVHPGREDGVVFTFTLSTDVRAISP